MERRGARGNVLWPSGGFLRTPTLPVLQGGLKALCPSGQAACGHGDVLLGVWGGQTDGQTKQRCFEFLLWCVYSSRLSGTLGLCLAVCVCVCICMSPHVSTRPGTWRNGGLHLCPSDADPPLLTWHRSTGRGKLKGRVPFLTLTLRNRNNR